MLAQVPFGRYVLEERLAQGGMGEVFRAVAVGEQGFQKPVVVKRVLPAFAGREDLAEMFVAEAKLMTRLAHPNIVEVYDFGRGEHRDYYLVLELVDGVDLGRLLEAFAARGARMPVPLALHVAAQALRGLHHAHTRLADGGVVVVHRDVSPSNVLLSTEGEVKVADFGVALVQREVGASGGVAGKLGYMAPEQYAGGVVDARADVFSVGVVLHEMLAGKAPFADQDAAARGEREALDVGEAIEAIVACALSPDPEARFASAKAMAQAIEELRDAGQRLATADDLAEVVRAAQRELPKAGKRVIALSGGADAKEDDDGPRELTRTGGAGGVGAFTVRAPRTEVAIDRETGPEPRTERIAPEERALPLPTPAAPPRSGVRRGAVAVAAVALVIGVVVFSARTSPRSEMPVPAPSATAPPVPSITPIASAPEPAITASASARPPVPTIAPRPAPPRASSAPAKDDDCTGKVHFSSEDSWDVTGGPTRAQTPGYATWRCGTYTLTARYRPDPSQTRTVTVTVRPDRQAEVKLQPK